MRVEPIFSPYGFRYTILNESSTIATNICQISGGLWYLPEMLVVNVGVDPEKSLQDRLRYQHEILRKRNA